MTDGTPQGADSAQPVRFYGSAAGTRYMQVMKRLRFRRLQRERSLANRDAYRKAEA